MTKCTNPKKIYKTAAALLQTKFDSESDQDFQDAG